MSYIIGIDGGGTSTTCLFQRIEKAYITTSSLQLTSTATNPQVVGFAQMQQTLSSLIQQGIDTLQIAPTDIAAICFGLAGVGREQDQAQATEVIRELIVELNLSPDIPFALHTDAQVALRGALRPEQSSGIIVISGTGSIAYGLDSSGMSFRSGGFGHMLGDEGSGYQIGLQALQAVCRASEYRAPKTVLTELILTACNISSEKELISYIYATPREKSEIAKFAELVIQASEQQDEVATHILINAGSELVLLVKSIAHQMRDNEQQHNTDSPPFLPGNFPVTTAGSIFQHSQVVRDTFTDRLERDQLGLYQPPHGRPVDGAVTIARELLHL